jgi:hypothetical protein
MPLTIGPGSGRTRAQRFREPRSFLRRRYARGVSLDRSLIADVRSLSDPELRRLVILAQDLLERRGAGRVPDGAKITYRREEVRCGKANCTRCPHGPYWYAYWREGGRLRSRYLGSARTRELHQPHPMQTAGSPGDTPPGVDSSADH